MFKRKEVISGNESEGVRKAYKQNIFIPFLKIRTTSTRKNLKLHHKKTHLMLQRSFSNERSVLLK